MNFLFWKKKAPEPPAPQPPEKVTKKENVGRCTIFVEIIDQDEPYKIVLDGHAYQSLSICKNFWYSSRCYAFEKRMEWFEYYRKYILARVGEQASHIPEHRIKKIWFESEDLEVEF